MKTRTCETHILCALCTWDADRNVRKLILQITRY